MRFLIAFAVAAALPGFAQNVKVTPLGSHAGELCARDRATIFEDPTGVRILYDAGESVLGADDPRLGRIDAIILSHAHGDHIGASRMKALEAGTCDAPQLVSAAPNSNTAEIAAAKNSVIVMVNPLGNFVGRKVENVRGKPTGQCPGGGGDVPVPQEASCLALAQTGGARTLRAAGAAKAVEIVVVPAMHESTVPASLLNEASRNMLSADGMSLTVGPSNGYVIRFTNGLVAYLTGDSGVHAEMSTLMRDFYKANLLQLNYGSSALDAAGAAYVVNTLVQPNSVIVSHVNERATSGGKLRPESRTGAFAALSKRPVHPAVSGRTMEFDGSGKCVAGCQQ